MWPKTCIEMAIRRELPEIDYYYFNGSFHLGELWRHSSLEIAVDWSSLHLDEANYMRNGTLDLIITGY